MGLFLDVVTLLLLMSFALSVIPAILPASTGNGLLRAKEAWLRLLLPPLSSLLLVGIAFWSTARALLAGVPDHCTYSHHPHLCWLHANGAGRIHDVVILLTIALLLCSLAWQISQWLQAHGRLSLLESLSDPSKETSLRAFLKEHGLSWPGQLLIIALDAPLCFLIGIRKPKLVVSAAILDLPPDSFRAIFAHEYAHLERGDNLRRILGQLAAVLHLPGLGGLAFRHWAMAEEMACDEIASRQTGGRLLMAETLVKVQRLFHQQGSLDLFLGSALVRKDALQQRVQLLLEDPRCVNKRIRWLWPLIPLAFWQADGIHHALEQLLAFLHP